MQICVCSIDNKQLSLLRYYIPLYVRISFVSIIQLLLFNDSIFYKNCGSKRSHLIIINLLDLREVYYIYSACNASRGFTYQ